MYRVRHGMHMFDGACSSERVPSNTTIVFLALGKQQTRASVHTLQIGFECKFSPDSCFRSSMHANIRVRCYNIITMRCLQLSLPSTLGKLDVRAQQINRFYFSRVLIPGRV